MSLPFTPAKTEPQLKDLLDLFRKDLLINLFCHHVGTIQTFDPIGQTATATINYQKTFFRLNETTGVYDNVLKPYPTLINCPVISIGGGSAALTFPIQIGDECLIMFNDRDLDNWYLGGSGGQTNTLRLHSFSDAVIIVGLRSLQNVILNYDTTRAVLRNATAMVGVGPTLIKIANATTTLGTQLHNLINQLNTLNNTLDTLFASQEAAFTNLTQPAAATACATAINTISGTIIPAVTAVSTALVGLLE